jgi:hypothetical protein
LHAVARAQVLAAVSRQARDAHPTTRGLRGDRLGANNAMYVLLMEEAVRRGCRVFDFGRSRVGSGAAAFKRHMGFQPAPLDYQFYFPRGGHPPAIHPGNPAMALPRGAGFAAARLAAGRPAFSATCLSRDGSLSVSATWSAPLVSCSGFRCADAEPARVAVQVAGLHPMKRCGPGR